jgi:predicted transcriptional regulator
LQSGLQVESEGLLCDICEPESVMSLTILDIITNSDYITLSALGISAVSLVVVIYFASRLRKLQIAKNHPEDVTDQQLEISAIVSEFSSRLKRLEEGLVDLKVKLEILDLRVARSQNPSSPEIKPVIHYKGSSYAVDRAPVPQSSVARVDSSEIVSRVPPSNRFPQESANRMKLGNTELEALRLVFEGRGKINAKEIQQKIDRTREHTARMMSGLYREGLVERDVTARPFSYSITQKGRDLLNG